MTLVGVIAPNIIMTPIRFLVLTALLASSIAATPVDLDQAAAASTALVAAVPVPEAALSPMDPRCRRSLPPDEQPHVSNIASDVEMSGGGMTFSLPVPLPNGPGSIK